MSSTIKNDNNINNNNGDYNNRDNGNYHDTDDNMFDMFKIKGYEHAYSANELKLQTKLQHIIKEGKKKLYLILDFDQTLTTSSSYSSWATIEKYQGFSQHYIQVSYQVVNSQFTIDTQPFLITSSSFYS